MTIIFRERGTDTPGSPRIRAGRLGVPLNGGGTHYPIMTGAPVQQGRLQLKRRRCAWVLLLAPWSAASWQQEGGHLAGLRGGGSITPAARRPVMAGTRPGVSNHQPAHRAGLYGHCRASPRASAGMGYRLSGMRHPASIGRAAASRRAPGASWRVTGRLFHPVSPCNIMYIIVQNEGRATWGIGRR